MEYIAGPASTFSMFNYQLGKGPYDIWSGGGAGINLCPFELPQLCGLITTLRKIVVSNFDQETAKTYIDLSSAFGMYLAENQVISPFCGDPLAYDEFHAQCKASSFCSLEASVVPSKKELISFTAEPMLIVIAVVYLSSTPIAVNFVEDFLPSRLRSLPYFEHMDQWFPNYQFISQGKGGMGFTRPAAHTLMDYMSYLSLRLALALWETKDGAWNLHAGTLPLCGYTIYSEVSGQSASDFDFMRSQRQGDKWKDYTP